VKPLFCSLGSLLIGCGSASNSEIRTFGRVQVIRKFLSYIQRASIVLFSSDSRTIKQLQNRLSRLVELIGTINERSQGLAQMELPPARSCH
jgi:hypothetical protein